MAVRFVNRPVPHFFFKDSSKLNSGNVPIISLPHDFNAFWR